MADNLTAFSSKCEILAELWMNYRDDQDFIDFVEYNDLGLPLAYALFNNIVESKPPAVEMINETFTLLLASLRIEDEGFELLDEMFDIAEADEENTQ